MDPNSIDEGMNPRNYFFKKKSFIIIAALLLVVGAATAAILLRVSKNPSFCSSCHIIKPYYQSWKEGPLLAAKHAEKGVKCLDCHQQGIPEKVREGVLYVSGNYETPLKERSFKKDECLKCHQDNWAKVVDSTEFEMSNPHDNHLGEIDCSLCHKMHRESEVYCLQCHDFDWVKELDEDWKN